MTERCPNEIQIEDSENTWANHKIHVLAELKRLAESEMALTEELVDLKTEVASLKTKMAIYIGLASSIAAMAAGIAVKLLG